MPEEQLSLQEEIKKYQLSEDDSEALLRLIQDWLTDNETLSLLNLSAHEHALYVLRRINQRKNSDRDRATDVKSLFDQETKAHAKFKELILSVPAKTNNTPEDEVDELIAYVPFEPTINQKEKNESNTRTALSYADATQNLAGFSGGLASASIQETADSLARSANVSNQTLVALRDPLPPNIAAGAHIASVVAGSLNLIIFPILLIRAALRGEKVKLSKDDTARLTRSAVTLGLGIAGLIVAPAIAIPLMIASAVFTAGTTLIGLGNFLWERWRLNTKIDNKRQEAEKLTADIQTKQDEAKNIKTLLAAEFKKDPLNIQAVNGFQHQLAMAESLYLQKIKNRNNAITEIKTLTQTRNREGTVRQILPRSLGFVVAATIIVGAVLLLVPPLAPVGIGIIIAGSAAGLALMTGVITSHIMLSRKGAEKEKKQNDIQLEKQRTKITHETTADLAKALDIKMDSHKERVAGITSRLEIITTQIQFSKTPEEKNKSNLMLVDFFITYCKIHQDDNIAALKTRPIFNEVPEKIRNAAFRQLSVLVNVENGKIFTPEQLSILQTFDKKHDFFHNHGINIEFLSTSSTKPVSPEKSDVKKSNHSKNSAPH